MNLILCGMMGVGKTTVGVEIARLSGRTWYDTDQLIVGKYGNIAEIFKQKGEAYFRNLETELVKALVQQDGMVLSTGGGLVLKEENCKLLRESGVIVYLRASVETLCQRLRADKDRPLLQSGEESLRQRLEDLLAVRAPAYEKAADFSVDVDGKTPQAIAGEILQKINKTVGTCTR